MIKAYIVDSFHHPETGQVLLVKLTSLPSTHRSVTRATARGDWGEIEFAVTSWRWPYQANSLWDVALTTTPTLDWTRCEELTLSFE